MEMFQTISPWWLNPQNIPWSSVPKKYDNDLIMCSTEMPCGKGWEEDEHLNSDVFAGWDIYFFSVKL